MRVRVPCTTSNLGSGFDCIGLAFNRYLEASFEPGGSTLVLERSGTVASLTGDVRDDLLARTFVDAMERLGRTASGVLSVRSEIPVARGLGSSAAATIAGLMLASAHKRGDYVSRKGEAPALDVLSEAAAREGHVDNVGPALLGGLVAVAPVVSDGSHAAYSLRRLTLSPLLGFSFAAPDVTVATPAARAALPANVPHALAVRSLARAVALVHGLAHADEESLRAGFQDELHVPYRLPLIPGAAAAFEAARGAGAWAATISGSGSGIIAVGPAGKEQEVADAMRDMLAAANPGPVIAFPLHPEPRGARILEQED
jgi:homoserine kinase